MSATWPSAVSTSANLYTAVNLLQTTLSGAINSAVTTITLASSTGFPTAGAVTIDSEVIFYTGISGAQLTGCTRAADGTTAASHSSGVPVGATIVAYHVNAANAEIIAIESYLDTVLGKGTAVTATEFGYVHGVTSALQTQLNLLAPKATPTFTGTSTFQGDATITRSSTGTVLETLSNTNASNVAAHAELTIQTDPAGGDPWILFATNGATAWAVGIDNSDSDKFKIQNSNGITTGTPTGIDIAPIGSMIFNSNGATALTLDSTQHALHIDGTVGAPAITFASDSDCGLYRIGTNDIALATNGTKGLEIDASQNVIFAGNAYNKVTTGSTTIPGIGTGTAISVSVTNSKTMSFNTDGVVMFWIYGGSGDGCLVVSNWGTATISILGTGGSFVASSSPSASQIGIFKSAGSHTVSIKSGSSAASTNSQFSILNFSGPVNGIVEWA